jgi:hypothetical protein
MSILFKSLSIFIVSISVFAASQDSSQNAEKILQNFQAHIADNEQNSSLLRLNESICNNDERQYLEIEQAIIAPFKAYFLQSQRPDLNTIFGKTFKSSGFPTQRGSLRKTFVDEGLAEFNFSVEENFLSQSDFLKKLIDYKKNAQKLEFVSFDTIQVYASKAMRSISLKELLSADLKVRFDIRYINSQNEKINDRGILKIQVSKKNSHWQIDAMNTIEGTSLVSKGDSVFKNTNVSLNDQIPRYLRREAIRRGGYATAFADINQDGKVDMLVATAQEVKLFKGDGLGQFEEWTNSGIGKHSLVKSAALVDLFNSGRQDIVLVRFAPEKDDSENKSDIIVYRNNGKKFERIEKAIYFKNNHAYAMPMAIGDFNKDSYLDLFIGFPGAKDFTFLKEKPMTQQEMLSHGFFINQGPKNAFYEKNAEELWKTDFVKSKIDKNHSLLTNPHYYFPHSAVAVDYNLDQNMDIVVVDDRTRLSPIYQGTDSGAFIKSNEALNVSVNDYGMGVAFGDLFGHQKMDLIMTSVNFAANERLRNSCEQNWDMDFSPTGSQGMRVYKSEGSGYAEVGKAYGLDFAGYGLSGVELIDYNNDGNLDVFVSNGLWSGLDDESDLDLSSLFARAANIGLFEMQVLPNGLKPYFEIKVGLLKNNNMTHDYAWLMQNYPTQSAVMNVLVNGKTKNGKKYSYGGFQRKRVFRNNGDNSFTEVAYGLGLDSMADGYMVASADVNNDGKQDIIFRNSDPGVDKNQYPPVEVYLNQIKNKNNSLRLQLVGGSGSNRDAVGSIVKAEVGSRSLLRQLTAMNGTVQSDKVIHIGMGENETAKTVEIIWPDGQKQKIENLKKGSYKIVEAMGPVGNIK